MRRVFEFLNTNHDHIVELVKWVVMYYLSKRVDGVNIQLPNISLLNVEADIDVSLLEKRVVAKVFQEYGEDDVVDEEDVEEVLQEELEKLESETE